MNSRVASAAIRSRSVARQNSHTSFNGANDVKANSTEAATAVGDNVSPATDFVDVICGFSVDESDRVTATFEPSMTSTPNRMGAGGRRRSIEQVRGTRTSVREAPALLAVDNLNDLIYRPSFRAPILGYEIVEQRPKFTIFKICVNRIPNAEGWFVFRRYTDFVRLHHKLKTIFPSVRFELPPKRWFRDNFDPSFLDERLNGLQLFVDSVLANSLSSASLPVVEFFCLDEPQDYAHDSIEESRARCETLENLVSSLKLELHEKRAEVELLKAELMLTRAASERSNTTPSDDLVVGKREQTTESESGGSLTNYSEQLYCTAINADVDSLKDNHLDVGRQSTLALLDGEPTLSKIPNLLSMDTNGNQMVS